jgi:RHS repeat-associated protein
VRDVVDDSGAVLNHVVYDAFGGVTSQTDESVVFRYGYTARELDAESGLQYNRARYLDSFTGKFISEDPINFKGGDSNLYRYVFNSPTNFLDPSGNFILAAPVAVGGLFLLGSAAILLLNSLQNQQNSVSPFIDKPEPLDPGPLTFPNPTPPRPEIETYPKPKDRDPNAINRGKDFGDIGKICRNLGFPLTSPLFPPYLQAISDNTSKDNEKENKQFKDAVKQIGRDRGRPLTRDEARRLHDEISGEGLSYQDIIETGKSIFGVD